MVWFMNGLTRINTGILPSENNQSWTIAGTGDFNIDGNADIIWRNTANGQNRIWFMNGVTQTGTGNLLEVTSQAWQIFNH
jgi:hypothetical protein